MTGFRALKQQLDHTVIASHFVRRYRTEYRPEMTELSLASQVLPEYNVRLGFTFLLALGNEQQERYLLSCYQRIGK